MLEEIKAIAFRYKRPAFVIGFVVLLCLAVYSVIDGWPLLSTMDSDSVRSLALCLGLALLYGLVLFWLCNRDQALRWISIPFLLLGVFSLIPGFIADGTTTIDPRHIGIALIAGFGIGFILMLSHGLLAAYLEPILMQYENETEEPGNRGEGDDGTSGE